jgi:integrase
MSLPERYRAVVYTAAYATLRFGECSALTRQRIDLVHRTISVTEQAQRVTGQGRVVCSPKSEAGSRVVAIPAALVAVLDDHLARFVDSAPDALVFTGEKGGPLERSNWTALFAKARASAELDWLHFHDLRHFAGTTAAQTGATTREIMARLGHSSPRAALIYQHASAERDNAIAEGLDALIENAAAASIAPIIELPNRAPANNRARSAHAV